MTFPDLRAYFHRDDETKGSNETYLANIECKICDFIKHQIRIRNCEGGLVCISGGIDSALTAYLTQSAIGQKNTLGLILSHEHMKKNDFTHARELVNTLNIEHKIVNVDPLIEDYKKALPPEFDFTNPKNYLHVFQTITTGISHNFARNYNYAVVSTSNKTEEQIGSFNIGGNVAEFFPIGDLSKTQVKQLAAYCKLPPQILSKYPSDGIKFSKTDEEYLGFRYETIVHIIDFLEKGMSHETIVNKLSLGNFNIEKIRRLEDTLEDSKIRLSFPACKLEEDTESSTAKEERHQKRILRLEEEYEGRIQKLEERVVALQEKPKPSPPRTYTRTWPRSTGGG